MTALGIALSLLVGVALGFFGGGGSILTVPLLVYVFGLEPKTAIASSLAIVSAASLAAALQHGRAGNLELRTALLFGSASVTGAYLGGRAGALLDGTLLLLLFAAMMALTSAAMWRGAGRAEPPEPARRSPPRLLAQGLGVGLFTGLVGAGGGFLVVPALVLWAGLSMPAALGTSLAIIAAQSLAGFAGYLSHVSVDPGLIAAVATSAIAGSVAGSQLARRVDPRSLRRLFAAFVASMAVVVLVKEAESWLGAAREALPHSAAQLLFACAVLAIGLAAGRASWRAPSGPQGERFFSDGAGI